MVRIIAEFVDIGTESFTVLMWGMFSWVMLSIIAQAVVGARAKPRWTPDEERYPNCGSPIFLRHEAGGQTHWQCTDVHGKDCHWPDDAPRIEPPEWMLLPY